MGLLTRRSHSNSVLRSCWRVFSSSQSDSSGSAQYAERDLGTRVASRSSVERRMVASVETKLVSHR